MASRRTSSHGAHVVKQVLGRVLPDWRTEISTSGNQRQPAATSGSTWYQHREAAQRADAALQRDAEIRERLGDASPRLSAASLHPWVWSAAQALWRDNHVREAVTAAAKKVNREAQNKVGRRDVTETALFQSAFSKDEPKPGQPRLRLMTDDGSDTFGSLQRGTAAFAEGCYAGIRNPNSHEDCLPRLPQHEALELSNSWLLSVSWPAGWTRPRSPRDRRPRHSGTGVQRSAGPCPGPAALLQ
ncbi:TIGR02391 family protein [Streptomyces sp. NPDC057474]|uniref:TIGR02391 family protein n=1 Tax=Streptomyces sp. NPDC057474 TaxID=3346144 RepID=UPI0036AE543E